MKTLNFALTLVISLSLLGLALTFTACSKDSPISVTEPDGMNDPPKLEDVQTITWSEGVPKIAAFNFAIAFISQTFGGELVLEVNGGAECAHGDDDDDETEDEPSLTLQFSVLPGSISQSSFVVLSLDDSVLAGNIDVQFWPSGRTFDPPALFNITACGLDLEGISPESVNIYLIDEEDNSLIPVETSGIVVIPEDGHIDIIDAKMDHFSRYVITKG